MQTLLQLLPAEVESPSVTKKVEWQVPEVQIVDEPRFAYRGKHFDPRRNWMPVEDVKKHGRNVDAETKYYALAPNGRPRLGA